MFINGIEIEDTFAEAFQMYGTRIIITAITQEWEYLIHLNDILERAV